jgi:hypothetical protein
MLKRVIAIMLASSLPHSAAAKDASDECLSGMREALVAGHFTGPLVCSKKNATFALVGRTTGGKYAVYDYRYRYMPEGGNAMHGGQKIVIFRGRSYVGQYALSPPPYVDVSVSGTDVVLKVVNDLSHSLEAVRLNLSEQLPLSVFINGETETLYR